MRKIGLFGGTFDPIHNGHIALAECVLKEMALDEIIFIPSGNPPHKSSKSVTDKIHRYNMVRLALSGKAFFSVSDYEINKQSPDYSYITISHFKEKYPEDEIFFIVGGDSFRDFPEWKNFETLISLCTFIVVARPGVKPSEYYEKYDGLKRPEKTLFLENFSCDISSTDVRNRIKNNEDLENKISAEVFDYIKTNNLYTQEP